MSGGGREGGGCCHQVPCPCQGGEGREGGVVTRSHVHVLGG